MTRKRKLIKKYRCKLYDKAQSKAWVSEMVERVETRLGTQKEGTREEGTQKELGKSRANIKKL